MTQERYTEFSSVGTNRSGGGKANANTSVLKDVSTIQKMGKNMATAMM